MIFIDFSRDKINRIKYYGSHIECQCVMYGSTVKVLKAGFELHEKTESQLCMIGFVKDPYLITSSTDKSKTLL